MVRRLEYNRDPVTPRLMANQKREALAELARLRTLASKEI
jgi:hypothetical protein